MRGSIGEAIIDYLKSRRLDSKCSNLFIRHIPPYGPIESESTLSESIKRYMWRAGIPVKKNPLRHHQFPVMFRILFNCGLPSAELRGLRVRDVDLSRNLFVIRDTKFLKNRLVPFTPSVADSLKRYLQVLMPLTDDLLLFPRPKTYGRYALYSASWLQVQLQILLRRAGIPYRGKGQGTHPRDTRHPNVKHMTKNILFTDVRNKLF